MNYQTLISTGRQTLLPLFIAGVTLSFSNASGWTQTQRRTGSRVVNADMARVVLPSGTVLPMRLDTAFSSKTSEQGDKFSATIKSGQDDSGLPEGTRVEGVVREVQASANGKPGILDIDFRRMVFPNGSAQAVKASLYSLNGKAVKREDGRLVATGDRSKDRLKWVGIGAGAGLVLSKVIKGNVLVDTLLGAGAGYLYNEVGTKPRAGDINLKEGTEFGVRLDRQLAFNSSDREYYRSSARSARNTGASSDFNSPSLDIRVLINNRTVRFDAGNRPFVQNGVLFVPLAAMGRAAEFDYRYDSSNKVIYARNDTVRLPLNSRMATVEGERHNLSAGAIMRSGVTYVPVQFIAWAADGEVDWNSESRTATLKTHNN